MNLFTSVRVDVKSAYGPSHEATRIVSTLLDGMLVYRRVSRNPLFYTLWLRSTERVIKSVLPKNTTQCTWPGLKTEAINPETNTLSHEANAP